MNETSIRLGFGSKKKNSVATTDDVWHMLTELFPFEFDPCPLDHDLTKWDGLKTDWKRWTYVNPPFNKIKPWLMKASTECDKGNNSVFLIPARVSTKYWKNLIWFNDNCRVFFLNGRVCFKGYDKPCPFGLSVIVFDKSKPDLSEFDHTPYVCGRYSLIPANKTQPNYLHYRKQVMDHYRKNHPNFKTIPALTDLNKKRKAEPTVSETKKIKV